MKINGDLIINDTNKTLNDCADITKNGYIVVRSTITDEVTAADSTVKFNVVDWSSGEYFTLNNYHIIVGENVKEVRVSATIWVENNDGYCWLSLRKNGSTISQYMKPARVNSTSDAWGTVSFPTIRFTVNQGDEIFINCHWSVTNKPSGYANRIPGGIYSRSVQMMVERVK